MKKKLIVMIITTIISMTAIACGSNNSDLVDGGEVVQESSEAGSIHSGDIQNTEINKEDNEEFIDDDSKNIEQEEIVPTWYMDSEGIKNEELGVVIRKDNADLDEIDLWEGAGIYTPNDDGNGGSIYQNVFRCKYYEGNLDTYISSELDEYFVDTSTIEKGKIHGVDYAYYGESWGSTLYNTRIIFAGNGIVLSAYLVTNDESIGDYLNRTNVIRPDDESNTDSLAYIADDGIHCPALGIKLSCDGENHINGMGVGCSWLDGSSVSVEDVCIDSGLFYYAQDAKNAQEAVDNYVESRMNLDGIREYSAMEDTVEINLGKCRYLGRSVIGQDTYSKYVDWLFYSDETIWAYTLTYHDESSKYEDYLHVIEDLE